MAEHYAGNALIVCFAGTDISAYIRSVDIDEQANAEYHDVTHKGDASKQYVTGIPGPETTVSYAGMDIYDSLHVMGTLGMNTQSTLVIYPYGTSDTYPKLTVMNALHQSKGQAVAYDGAAELSGAFHAKNTLTRATHST